MNNNFYKPDFKTIEKYKKLMYREKKPFELPKIKFSWAGTPGDRTWWHKSSNEKIEGKTHYLFGVHWKDMVHVDNKKLRMRALSVIIGPLRIEIYKITKST